MTGIKFTTMIGFVVCAVVFDVNANTFAARQGGPVLPVGPGTSPGGPIEPVDSVVNPGGPIISVDLANNPGGPIEIDSTSTARYVLFSS